MITNLFLQKYKKNNKTKAREIFRKINPQIIPD